MQDKDTKLLEEAYSGINNDKVIEEALPYSKDSYKKNAIGYEGASPDVQRMYEIDDQVGDLLHEATRITNKYASAEEFESVRKFVRDTILNFNAICIGAVDK